MLTITPAKNLQGKIDLPPDPDLFMLVSIMALARRQRVVVTPVFNIPVLQEWERQFSGHLVFEWTAQGCGITPVTVDPPLRVSLESCALPWRDYSIFILLGMGKTVVFKTIDRKRCSAWEDLARRLGYRLIISPYETSTCLALADEPVAVKTDTPDETDLPAFLGLLLGTGAKHTFTITNPLSSPLRSLAPAFGYAIEAKSSIPRERDELTRRIQLMQQKNRKTPSAGQQFTITTDFTLPSAVNDQPLAIVLPGDTLTGALLTEAKCLFPKNALVIGNMLLESWATPLLPFIRKMGCKVSVQETGRTTFGSVGILHIQSTGLIGRKIECIPAGHYAPYLPAMVIISIFAQGESVFRELLDLRNDEPDGIATIEACIRTLGAHHGEMPDGIVLKGGHDFDGFDLDEPLSAPCAAAFAVAGLRCTGTTGINDEQLGKRLPGFAGLLESICERRA